MGGGGRGRRGQVWIWAEITSVRKTFLVHEEHRCREINMKELGRVRLGKLGKLRQWARKPVWFQGLLCLPRVSLGTQVPSNTPWAVFYHAHSIARDHVFPRLSPLKTEVTS